MESQSSVVVEAIIYSCIAFSIVFIVLGGLTVVIYAMRMVTGSATAGGTPPVASAARPQPQAPSQAQSTDVKARHVAAITAAILAATQGRGRVVNIAPASHPQQQQRAFSSETTRIWRTMAVVESSSRRFIPSWKQQ
ncbi:MAG: OadG family protein [Synergistaceae bacterium]|jgi:Na+-transporting methylmalonyl-CoA/oxaloacetate decarboxylase gamma subunit|nr:OadG family protein [Synergistaceae bacterium]